MPKSPSLLSLFPLGSELRQFGHSGLFTRLLDLGWRVVVAAKIPDEDLKAQLDRRVEIMDLPLERLPFGLVHLTTALLDRAHAERERRRGKSGWQYKKVVAHNWKERVLYAAQAVLGKALSFSRSGQKLLSAREAAAIRNLSSPKCEEFLRLVKPDVIMLNVPRSDALLPLLSAAQARQIPAILLYHTWKDVTVNGRLNFAFTHYGVWSESMRAELLRQNPGIDSRFVSLTGCGHFQCVGRQDLLIPEAEFRTALGARPHSKLVVLPASAPWMVPEEERYIRLLQSALKDFKSVGDVQIVVRINPMDGDGRLAEVLRADAPEIIVSKPDWRWDRKRNWCFQRRSDQVLYNSLLNYASACIGMPSTVTVECAVADVPIINIGFDLPGPAVQPGAVRKFWDADFYEEVRQTGAAKLVESPGNLAAAVEEALVHPELVRQSRHALLERQLGIAPHAAVDAAVQVLLETVKPELRPREGNAFYQCSRKEDPPLKTTITTLLLRLPGGRILLQKIRRYRFHKNLRKFPNSKAIFDYYYKTRFWGSAESVSGPGSTIQNTENARRGIANVIKRLQVRRLLDAPCGDYNWFRLIQRDKDVQYIGGDIVDSLIAENATKHGNQNTSFLPIDITHDPLPCADLWICRDVFLHFSYRDIFLTMNNFVRNNIQYLLTTSYINAGKNTDIPTGSARPVNLQLPPFNFCKPIEYINDYVEGQPVRCLCLWERKALLETLLHNREFQRLANDTNCLSTTAPRLRS